MLYLYITPCSCSAGEPGERGGDGGDGEMGRRRRACGGQRLPAVGPTPAEVEAGHRPERRRHQGKTGGVHGAAGGGGGTDSSPDTGRPDGAAGGLCTGLTVGTGDGPRRTVPMATESILHKNEQDYAEVNSR
ncbi:unnamed protein product [Arctogadus glacialis]